jgi:hypothetical protein
MYMEARCCGGNGASAGAARYIAVGIRMSVNAAVESKELLLGGNVRYGDIQHFSSISYYKCTLSTAFFVHRLRVIAHFGQIIHLVSRCFSFAASA